MTIFTTKDFFFLSGYSNDLDCKNNDNNTKNNNKTNTANILLQETNLNLFNILVSFMRIKQLCYQVASC